MEPSHGSSPGADMIRLTFVRFILALVCSVNKTGVGSHPRRGSGNQEQMLGTGIERSSLGREDPGIN